MLTENSSGQSGSFFFHTADMKFMIKTIKTTEFTFLKKKLVAYYNYIVDNPETLLAKYYGLHKLKCYSAKGKVVETINIGKSLALICIFLSHRFNSSGHEQLPAQRKRSLYSGKI